VREDDGVRVADPEPACDRVGVWESVLVIDGLCDCDSEPDGLGDAVCEGLAELERDPD
jgi:hypothetical protein